MYVSKREMGKMFEKNENIIKWVGTMKVDGAEIQLAVTFKLKNF